MPCRAGVLAIDYHRPRIIDKDTVYAEYTY
jgi:hypothetical protein